MSKINKTDRAPNRDGPLDQAKALHAAGRLDEAKRAYKKLLNRRPQDADLRHLAGVLAWQAGDAAGAEIQLRHAVRLRDGFAEAHNNLGLVLAKTDRRDEAAACYRRAVELQPDYALALKNLSLLLMRMEYYEEAVPYLDRLLALEPDNAEALNNRGVAHQRLGRLEAALSDLEQATERQPDYAVAHLNKGETLQRLNRLDEAEVNLRRAVALEPKSAKFASALGIVLIEKQQIDEGIAFFETALRINPAYDAAINNLAIALRFRPDHDAAIARCREALSTTPDEAALKTELASLLWLIGEFGEAGDLLEAVLNADPDSATAAYWFGLVRQSRHDFAGARQHFERALALDPADVHAEAALANLAARELAPRDEGAKRVALHISQRYHYRILKPVFDALVAEGHVCWMSPHVPEMAAFEPDLVVLADSHACHLRPALPKSLFVWVRHGLISKNTTVFAARVADFTCLTSEASRDWYIQFGGYPRREFWITGYPQMDKLFQPGALPLDVDIKPGRKVVLYAPTWTPGLSSADMLGDRVVDLIRGDRRDITLLIKPHPVTVIHRPEWLETWRAVADGEDNVYLFDDPAADVMPFLKRADVLVTDASSVMFQYLAVNRPLVLITNPDRFRVSHYDPRGIEWCWRDVGQEVYDPADVAGAVHAALEDPSRGEAARLRYRRELFGDHTDGRAGERIARQITELAL